MKVRPPVRLPLPSLPEPRPRATREGPPFRPGPARNGLLWTGMCLSLLLPLALSSAWAQETLAPDRMDASGLDLALSLAVLLEGPYAGGTAMNTALTAYLPETDPYGLGTTVAPGFFATSTGQTVVDWVLVEVRTGTPSSPPMTVVAEAAGLLLDDGTVVASDGTSTLTLSAEWGAYYVVVRHRNHLDVMSAAALDCSSGSCAYNFTTSSGQAYGSAPMADLSGTGSGPWALVAGDADGDGQVIATDYQNYWRVQNGSGEGYQSADFDLDAQVIATDYQNYWRVNNSRESRVPDPN